MPSESENTLQLALDGDDDTSGLSPLLQTSNCSFFDDRSATPANGYNPTVIVLPNILTADHLGSLDSRLMRISAERWESRRGFRHSFGNEDLERAIGSFVKSAEKTSRGLEDVAPTIWPRILDLFMQLHSPCRVAPFRWAASHTALW